MAESIEQLRDGINGKNVITDVLEKMMKDLSDNRVPEGWMNSYFSLKPLASWYNDLINRYEFFSEWAQKGLPPIFMIGYFTYPTGFTTAILQKFSRKPSSPSIDLL
jgi:dynein heavy chain